MWHWRPRLILIKNYKLQERDKQKNTLILSDRYNKNILCSSAWQERQYASLVVACTSNHYYDHTVSITNTCHHFSMLTTPPHTSAHDLSFNKAISCCHLILKQKCPQNIFVMINEMQKNVYRPTKIIQFSLSLLALFSWQFTD